MGWEVTTLLPRSLCCLLEWSGIQTPLSVLPVNEKAAKRIHDHLLQGARCCREAGFQRTRDICRNITIAFLLRRLCLISTEVLHVFSSDLQLISLYQEHPGASLLRRGT